MPNKLPPPPIPSDSFHEDSEDLARSITILSERIRELSSTVADNRDRIAKQDAIIAEQANLNRKAKRNFVIATVAACVAVVVGAIAIGAVIKVGHAQTSFESAFNGIRSGGCAQGQQGAATAIAGEVESQRRLAQALIEGSGGTFNPKDPAVVNFLTSIREGSEEVHRLRNCTGEGLEDYAKNAPKAIPCPDGVTKDGYCKSWPSSLPTTTTTIKGD